MKWRLSSQGSVTTKRRFKRLATSSGKRLVLAPDDQPFTALLGLSNGGDGDNREGRRSGSGRADMAAIDFELAEPTGINYRFLQSEALRLLQELQIHRVELEMQNDELRRAVDEAEEIKQRYVDLYEFAPVGYFTLDANTHIVRANLTGALLLGEERPSLLNKPFTRWVRQSEKIVFHSFLQRALQGNLEDSIEVTLISSTPKVRTVLVKAGTLETDGSGGKLCRLTALDISLRKQAEQALENERELFAIFQSAPSIMILLDESFRVVKANRAALQAVRRDMDESQGLRLGEMLRCMNASAENGGCGTSPGCLSCFIRDMQIHPQVSNRECHQVEIKLLLNIGSGTVEFFALFSTTLLNIEGRRLALVCIEDVTERKKAADELQAYQTRLEDLASQLFVAQEGERRRIAADLHDGVVQRMGLCSQKLKLLRSENMEGNVHLDEVIKSLDQAIAESRSLIGELSPPVLHILGLGPALEWLAQGFSERRGLEVDLNLEDLPPGVEREVRIFLYRSCAELLTNVVKHAQSRKSRVNLTLSENELTLSVEDAGRGFVHSMEAYGGGQGFGLFNISEMLRKWNGRLKVEHSVLGGAKVSMVLPVYACWPLKQSEDQ